MRIFVTGSSAHLARACLPLLCADARVESIVGIDIAPSQFSHIKFTAHKGDIRGTEVKDLMRGCDALLHLAWRVLRGKMSADEMHDVNVRGSRCIFEAARAAGISRLIHLSSAAVYGSGDDLSEMATFNPRPDFLYAQHKVAVETYLAREFPQAIRLRPHIILGPQCQPLLKLLLRQPTYPIFPEPQPQLQCVHEADVAKAIRLSLFSTEAGAFNLATTASYSFKDAIHHRHRHPIALPLSLLKNALSVAHFVSGFGGEPAWLSAAQNTLTLDCTRAQRELHWQAQYTAAATLASV